jgi:hypothetical protein
MRSPNMAVDRGQAVAPVPARPPAVDTACFHMVATRDRALCHRKFVTRELTERFLQALLRALAAWDT